MVSSKVIAIFFRSLPDSLFFALSRLSLSPACICSRKEEEEEEGRFTEIESDCNLTEIEKEGHLFIELSLSLSDFD